jgi:WD40 repeat protein
VSAAGDETLKVWDLMSGMLSADLLGHKAAIYNCAALGDGRRVVSGSGDGTLKLWDAQSGECLGTIYGSEGAGFFAVIASGSFVFAGDMIGNVWMLEVGDC